MQLDLIGTETGGIFYTPITYTQVTGCARPRLVIEYYSSAQHSSSPTMIKFFYPPSSGTT